jgi:SH3-like domain-containing protein
MSRCLLFIIFILSCSICFSTPAQDLLDAVNNQNFEELKDAIKNGADINVKDKDGSTALMSFSKWGYLEIGKYLIEKGADINAKDNDGWTTLMIVSLNGRLEIVEYLVEKGVDINIKNNEGKTALIIASENSNNDIVDYLSIKNNTRWVTTEAGLQMREKPDINAKKIDTIPYTDQVKILEEKGVNITISGATGKWCKVEWKDKTGWVFGGFLSNIEPEKKTNITLNYFIGNWNDMDPDCMDGECGGDLYISFYKDGKCIIQQSGGGYDGKWKYDSKKEILVLYLVYTDGYNGKEPETKTYNCKIKNQTENKMELINLSNEFPMLGILYRSK